MDRCALFVDAGYLLADGAMAVHGTRHRETVSWDFGGLLQLLSNLARERTGIPLLRCYWYEATIEARRSAEHEALADLPGLKLRLGRIRPGRREGVDTEIHRDLMTLARNEALADAVVVSGDEDIARVVADAQDLGVRVTIVHVAVDGNWTISRVLRQECDDLIEIGSGHLRPYVNLLAGVDGSSSLGTSPLSNGHSNGSSSSLGSLQSTPQNGPPPSSPLGGQPVPSAPSVRDLGPAMTSNTSMATGPLPLPSSNGPGGATRPGGSAGFGSFGNGAVQPPAPLQAAPTYGPSSTQAPPQLPATGSQYNSPAPSPSSQPPPQSLPQSLPQPLPSNQSQPVQQQMQQPAQQPTGQPHGPYTGPQQIAPAPAQQSAPTLADAVKAAHQEGQDFGESVARDAPALWLEAVLARKPRMPSDLEARLLQGSSLPIDFLLHDEVRHALRRGFWDALERSRR
ncbi:NYN domain-containing protein [Actinomadura macra]|uniref:NYN domain-containing protein n=1 Tax=Actinomadura macra TaxID=46164 RepID=UPI00082F5B2A|nr:NYN domain-containing protein [Actinomadura macra]